MSLQWTCCASGRTCDALPVADLCGEEAIQESYSICYKAQSHGCDAGGRDTVLAIITCLLSLLEKSGCELAHTGAGQPTLR